MSLLDQMQADASAQAAVEPSTVHLTVIANLGQQQADLAREIEADEEALKEKVKRFKKLTEFDIPMYLKSLGMTSYRLTDGSSVDVTTKYDAQISEKRREAAHKWLRDHNFGDLIKNELIIEVGKGEDRDEKVRRLTALAVELGLIAERKEAVHAGTLKAFVKEQVEKQSVVELDGPQPDAIPHELFGIFIRDVAEITQPKTSKPKRKKS